MQAPKAYGPDQGPVWPLDEPVEVGPDPRVVLQTGQGGHIEDLAQPRPTSVGHALFSTDPLPGVMPGRIGARELDELSAVAILVDRAHMGKDASGRRPSEAGDAEQIATFLHNCKHLLDLMGERVNLIAQEIDAPNQTSKFPDQRAQSSRGDHRALRPFMNSHELEPPEPATPTGGFYLRMKSFTGRAAISWGVRPSLRTATHPGARRSVQTERSSGEDPIELMAKQRL